jgi:uncharacterized repeat protein (TIGR03843 family)
MRDGVELNQIMEHLQRGRIRLAGRFLWGSNYTLLAEVDHRGETLQAVYKPATGERPLWDFPHGTLAAREVAAYITAREIGWGFIPPTVLRSEGPAGPGSLQLYVDADPERHYFTLSEAEKQRLRPVALLDVIMNNADRKGGHILLGPDGHIWLIDHGLCFHEEPKLRTVIWDFAGERVPETLLTMVDAYRDRMQHGSELWHNYCELLSAREVAALARRTDEVLRMGRFPDQAPGRPFPWPLV